MMTPKLAPEQLVRLVNAKNVLAAFTDNTNPSDKVIERAKEAANCLDTVVGELVETACN